MKRTQKYLLGGVSLLVIVAMVVFVLRSPALLDPLRALHARDLWPLLVLTVIFLWVQGLLLKVSAQFFGVKLQFKEWFGVLVLTLFGNYFLPFAGVGFRAIYLKKKHRMEYAEFMAMTLGIYWAELLVFAVGGFVGLLLNAGAGGVYRNLALAVTGAGVLALLGMYVWTPILQANSKLAKKFGELLTAWARVKNQGVYLGSVVLVTTVEFLVYVAMIAVASKALGFGATWSYSLIAAYFSDYSFFIRLLPAAVGTYELALVISSSLGSLPKGGGLLMAALLRCATVVIFLILTPIFSYALFGTWKKIQATNEL